MRERDEPKNAPLRITNQFRGGGGMTYDLRFDGVRLTLVIAERTRADEPGDWRIEARGASGPENKAVVVEWGPTRADALRSVGRAWCEASDTIGLRVFDWDAVAGALASVKAI